MTEETNKPRSRFTRRVVRPKDGRRKGGRLIVQPVRKRVPGVGFVYNAPETDRLLWSMQRRGWSMSAEGLMEAATEDWKYDKWTKQKISSGLAGLYRRGDLIPVARGIYRAKMTHARPQ